MNAKLCATVTGATTDALRQARDRAADADMSSFVSTTQMRWISTECSPIGESRSSSHAARPGPEDGSPVRRRSGAGCLIPH